MVQAIMPEVHPVQAAPAPAPAQRYAWRYATRLPVSPQVAGEELDRIARANDGVIRPRDVVDASRDPTAPLHPAFTWDDVAAAEKCREQEARQIVRSIAVYRPESDAPQIKYVSVHVRPEEPSSRGYVDAARVMETPELRNQALTEALSLLRGIRRRYNDLGELAEVFAAIDAACA